MSLNGEKHDMTPEERALQLIKELSLEEKWHKSTAYSHLTRPIWIWTGLEIRFLMGLEKSVP